MNMTECSPFRRPHALIVEDEVMIALGLQADLEALGFEVIGLAANARQAISLAIEDKPDLVVMDIYLNGARDGIEAARSIRETFGTQIVFVTAYTDDDGIMERIHKQVPHAPVLAKPLYGDRLANAIEQVQSQAASAIVITKSHRERQFTGRIDGAFVE
jgi:two-component system, response regulator PdtaR